MYKQGWGAGAGRTRPIFQKSRSLKRGFSFFKQYHHVRCLEVDFLRCGIQIWKNFLDHDSLGVYMGGREGDFYFSTNIIM